jgi:putative transposase
MSRTLSPSSNKPYGVARVTAVWALARSSYYAGRKRQQEPRVPHKRGHQKLSDEKLVSEIRQVLAQSKFHGEGYRSLGPPAAQQRTGMEGASSATHAGT